jgi:carbohydrate-selective porin OprB
VSDAATVCDTVSVCLACRFGSVCAGGIFFLLAEEHHGGPSIADDVAAYQLITNIQARDFMQVGEYWWSRSFRDGALEVRLGKQDINRLFSVVEMGGHFVRASFQYPRMNPMPSYPDPSMGAAAGVKLSDALSFGAGVCDGRPFGGNWGFSGSGVTFSICEMRLRHKAHGTLPGDCNAGMWYNSDRWNAVAPGSTRVFAGNYGAYLNAEQWLWRKPPERDGDDEGQGRPALGVFCQYAWNPPDRNKVWQYWGAGMVFGGPLPGRDHDLLGGFSRNAELLDRNPAASKWRPGARFGVPSFPAFPSGGASGTCRSGENTRSRVSCDCPARWQRPHHRGGPRGISRDRFGLVPIPLHLARHSIS